jgi:hypothetical protein
MEKQTDWNDVAALEKAISEKYGADAVVNPRSLWDEEKEKAYREQLKVLAKKRKNISKIVRLGQEIEKETLIKNSQERLCPFCQCYSFSSQDDIYMTRFGCCYGCFVKYIDGREERWMSGWRPVEGK